MKKSILIAVLMVCSSTTVYAGQAWRDCIPNSISPGGCDSIGPGGGKSIGPGGGLSIGPGGGLSIGPGGGNRLDRVADSLSALMVESRYCVIEAKA